MPTKGIALAGVATLVLALLLAAGVQRDGGVLAAPSAGPAHPHADHKRGDEDRPEADDDDDDDDRSGQGRGRGRGRGRGGDDDDAAIAAPVIPAAQRGDLVIEIVDERFVPATATIQAGQRITFVNLDDDEHTATGPGFDTGDLLPGEWRTVTVERAGAVPYVCRYHPEMVGEITVFGAAEPAASPVASPVALPIATDEIAVDVLDFAFAATRLEVAPGTRVTWINTGVAPHTVTGSFGDSGMLQTGDEWSFVFTDTGEFEYVCLFHPDMRATIVVTGDPEVIAPGSA